MKWKLGDNKTLKKGFRFVPPLFVDDHILFAEASENQLKVMLDYLNFVYGMLKKKGELPKVSYVCFP